MTAAAIYRPAGSVFDFPFSTKDQYGKLADVDEQGNLALFSNDVFECIVPATAVTFPRQRKGLYVAKVNSAHEDLLALVSANCFDSGRVLSAAMEEITADGIEELGDYLPRIYIIGTPATLQLGGPWALTVTVTSSAGGNLQNARVRIYETGTTGETKETGSNGQPSDAFALQNGLWNWLIWKAGFASRSGTFTVDDADPTALAIALTPKTVAAPSDPTLCACYFTAFRGNGSPAQNETFWFAIIEGDGSSGQAVSKEPDSTITDDDGFASFEAIRGKRYRYWPDGREQDAKQFDVPDEETFPLPELVGDF